jgi:ribosomal protein L9
MHKSAGEGQSAVLAVLVPRFGQKNELKRVHIGTPSTYTKARYKAAVARAIEIRTEATARYEADATRAKRKEATEMKKALRAAAQSGA